MESKRRVMCSCGRMFTTPVALWNHHVNEAEGIAASHAEVESDRDKWRAEVERLRNELARLNGMTRSESDVWAENARLRAALKRASAYLREIDAQPTPEPKP